MWIGIKAKEWGAHKKSVYCKIARCTSAAAAHQAQQIKFLIRRYKRLFFIRPLIVREMLWALLFTDLRLLVEGRHFAASMSTPPPRVCVDEPCWCWARMQLPVPNTYTYNAPELYWKPWRGWILWQINAILLCDTLLLKSCNKFPTLLFWLIWQLIFSLRIGLGLKDTIFVWHFPNLVHVYKIQILTVIC